jgi:2-polyprenyl-3-methyl-5-hydroxy-6-metoxy-1,4-benzoquinol methylase
MNALNHVADIETSLKTLVDHLSPSGQLIASVDCHNYWAMQQLFRILPGDILHPQQYKLDDYLKMFKKHALKVTTTRCVHKGYLFSHYLIVLRKTA